MKKQEYITPETACVFVEIESTLCQSGISTTIEGFDSLGSDDFTMFSDPSGLML